MKFTLYNEQILGFQLADFIFVLVVVLLLLIMGLLLKILNIKEKNMEKAKKSRMDMLDLETITKNIERDYKPLNIELTTYEKEQENSAIISYEELVNTKGTHNINYDDSYEYDSPVSVKKVELEKSINPNETIQPRLEVTLMSYEKEEAFLKALKKLQRDLAS